jgi:uracil-DNA glycosylase
MMDSTWDFLSRILDKHLYQQFFKHLSSTTYSPELKYIFKPFEDIDFYSVKVVIVGQSPYPSKSTGHAFEYHELTPTLKVIFNALNKLGYSTNTTKLDKWIKQGVLLLNSSLTIGTGIYKSINHSTIWEPFLKETLKHLSSKKGVVFMFWGREAQNLSHVVNDKYNLVLKGPYPQIHSEKEIETHFTHANLYLSNCIDWNL